MSAAKRKGTILAGIAGLSLIAMSAGTQQVAHHYNYPREFGPGIVDVGHHRIYAPWSLLPWSAKYGERYKSAFDLAQLTTFGTLAFPLILAAAFRRKRKREVRRFGADAWGTISDAKVAGLVDPKQQPRGRVLGMMDGKRLTYSGVEHSLVVGASRSGKGVGYVIPTVAAWEQSIFVYDRKGEIWEITADHRKRFSHTFYFAPTDPNTARFNPLFEVRKGFMEIADIQNIVVILVDPLGRKAGDLSFWDQSATDFFVGLILHVLYSAPDEKKNLTHVRELLLDIEPTLDAMLYSKHRYRADPHEPDGLFRDEMGNPVPEVHPEVRLGATAFRNMDERVRSSVLATCRASLTLFADPLVSYATSWSDFAIGDLVCSKQPVSFYLITPQAHADRLSFLVRIMLRQTINSLMEHIGTDSRGRAKNHRMLLMLDEFPKLGALPFLESALGEMAGYGITTQLICQSFNDVFGKYGVHSSIFDNMHITSTFATSEPNSIEKIIKRAGKALEYRESFSDPRSFWHKGGRTTSVSEQERYILAEQDVRALEHSKQMIFVNNAKPIVADKLRYFEDPFFKTVTTDFFHGELALHKQTPATIDLPGKPQIDWIGVRAVEPYEPAQPAPTTSPDDDPAVLGMPSTEDIASVPRDYDADSFYDPIDDEEDA